VLGVAEGVGVGEGLDVGVGVGVPVECGVGFLVGDGAGRDGLTIGWDVFVVVGVGVGVGEAAREEAVVVVDPTREDLGGGAECIFFPPGCLARSGSATLGGAVRWIQIPTSRATSVRAPNALLTMTERALASMAVASVVAHSAVSCSG
jgi:hypothetical protein